MEMQKEIVTKDLVTANGDFREEEGHCWTDFKSKQRATVQRLYWHGFRNCCERHKVSMLVVLPVEVKAVRGSQWSTNSLFGRKSRQQTVEGSDLKRHWAS
ncbi:hypothetical protein V7S43_015960 [Phytophthora oleae]|uniref:Uncharacterized protein n=1 Tax=Phytophthora oleae TaxID=2107226 RepID=A0ABD3EXQ8_9STRA